MRLSHNINSLKLLNNYNKAINQGSASVSRISSGERFTSAKDSPNKIGQSEQMRIQLKSMDSAKKNLQDGTSMLQAADGALQEVNSVLDRMRELTVQASNGTNNDQDKKAVQTEIDQMKETLKDLSNNTEFNGVKLIGNQNVVNNKYPQYQNVVIGAMVGEQTQIPLYNTSPSALKDSNGNTLENIDVTTYAASQSALEVIDASIDTVNKIRSKFGAISNVFENTADNLDENYSLTETADSNIRDTDIASEIAEYARTQILSQTGVALIAQSNNFPKDALKTLENVR